MKANWLSATAKYALAVILVLLCDLIPLQSQGVVINELLASNTSVNFDPDFQDNVDWIELYNPESDTLDLGGYFLTDNMDDPQKWQFPQGVMLPPGRFLVVWADGRDTVLNFCHTSFKLSMEGEEIAIYDPENQRLDSVVFESQQEDISYGRQPDGGPLWYRFDKPTPGVSNSGEAYLKLNSPELLLPAGFYTSDQILEMKSDDTLAAIRYTTNGDEPTESSPLYSGTIQVKSRAGDPNIFSEIRTNLDPFHWLPDWVPPAGEVFKATVIRARAFREGYQPSDIITRSYFVDPAINQRYPTLAVISINSDSRNLFDNQTGIYVPGVNHRQGYPGTGNYFMDWEKPAHIEFFEPGGILGFEQEVGISIQGGSSPASPQKGLHVIARGEYGKNRVRYPLFEDDPSSAKELTEFKRFIIRAWGSLITGSLFNDAYAHRLMAEQDLDIQAYRPVVLFINGEYWGIHALREANKNSWYYQFHHGIDREDPGCDILQHGFRDGQPYPWVDEGDDTHWNTMVAFIKTHDMIQEENYNYLKTLMETDNFITYMGHCIHVGKWDWPNNNDASWRPRVSDGRWRWIQFDMETGFGVGAGLGPEYSMLGPQFDMFEAAIKGVEIPDFGRYGPHPILARIYQNREFSEAFVDWFVERFNHEFQPDSMNRILDEMAAEIRPYMQEYKHRWPFIGEVRGGWETSLENIRDFNNQRVEYMSQHILRWFDTEKIFPVSYKLRQNYPNPFTTSTTIKYQLPVEGNITIRVFNGLGQQVAVYQNRHDTGGHFSVQFNAAGMAAGIYFYTLEAGGESQVRKMLVLKQPG